MKKIIIIGATSGIGRGLAEVYSQEDYLIGITGRRENLLEEVCAGQQRQTILSSVRHHRYTSYHFIP